MLEIPEATVISNQINNTVKSELIHSVEVGHSPHKFVWFHGDGSDYASLMTGKKVEIATSRGGMVEILLDGATLVFGDGINLRFHANGESRPEKHQLLLEFEDGTALSASAAMYGGILCTPTGANDNPYYLIAIKKPSPLSELFSLDYFLRLFNPESEKMSLKAFLATEQRIPGLGNGVLQDILYNAGMHPKTKVSSLGDKERGILFEVVQSTLHEMTRLGGRDTERDLFGNPGGYSTKLSKNTAGKECPRCGQIIRKEAYMGGSIYFCPGCQPVV